MRDVAQRARQGSRAEQGALRTAQYLEALQVIEFEVGRKQRDGNRRLIQVDADLFLDAGLVANDLARADAAHGNLALSGAEIRDGEAGDVARQIGNAGHGCAAQLLRVGRGYREGHLVQRHHAFLRGDNDFGQDVRALCVGWRRGDLEQGGRHGNCPRNVLLDGEHCRHFFGSL